MHLANRLLSHFILPLLLSSLALAPNTAFSDVKQQKQSQLKALQDKINQLQNTIAVKQNSKNQYVKKLRSIEKNIGFLNQKIKKSEHAIKTSKKRLKKLKRQQKALSKSLNKNKSALEKQIYGAYTQGKNSQLQMIFNQQDPAQFQRQLMFYQYVTAQQSEIIDAVNADIALVEKTQHDINTENKRLIEKKQQFVAHKKTLSKDRSKRNKIVSNLNKQLKKQGNYLNSLNDDAEQLKNLIASINVIFKDSKLPSKPFKKLKGKLPWPLKGTLRTMYGHLKPLSNLKWQGNVIYAPEGNYVRAISDGQVAYADWLKGFGNLIILDHGDSYLSLYSHNQSLFKAPGEKVTRGEIIGSAGDSGGIKKSGIYFEIRKKGKPQNPAIWCNRKNKFIS